MSPVRRVGNRAFQALNDAFSIPGPDNLNAVDIGVASPVLELGNIVREGVAEPWTFQLEIVHAGADSTSQRISPYVFGDWTNVFKHNQEQSSEVPTGLQVLFVNVGAISTAAINSLIIEHRPTQGSAMGGVPTEQLFMADTRISNRVAFSGGSPISRALPWSTNWATWVEYNTPGAATLRLSLTALVAPRGIIGRFSI